MPWIPNRIGNHGCRPVNLTDSEMKVATWKVNTQNTLGTTHEVMKTLDDYMGVIVTFQVYNRYHKCDIPRHITLGLVLQSAVKLHPSSRDYLQSYFAHRFY